MDHTAAVAHFLMFECYRPEEYLDDDVSGGTNVRIRMLTAFDSRVTQGGIVQVLRPTCARNQTSSQFVTTSNTTYDA